MSRAKVAQSSQSISRAAALWVVGVAGLGVAWTRSPWPSALVLKRLGARADSERLDRLAANEAVEPLGVETVALDRRYGRRRSNRLDVFTVSGIDTEERAAERSGADGRSDDERGVDRDGVTGPTHKGLPTFVWVHGGGFIGGTKDDARSWLKLVAAEGFTTVGVEYTLAPAGRYPTQVEEVASAVRHVVENADELGVDPTRIVLGGDSAGAHISGQLGISIIDPKYAASAGLPRPIPPSHLRSLILSCGVYDLTLGKDAPGMAGWMVRTILWAYTGDQKAALGQRYAHASLVDHVPTDLPPVYVTAGNDDPLRGHTTRFARALGSAGIDVINDVVARDEPVQLPHDYQMDMRHDRSWNSLATVVELMRRTTR